MLISSSFSNVQCVAKLLIKLLVAPWPSLNNLVSAELIGRRGQGGQMIHDGTSRCLTVLRENHENPRMQLIMANVSFIACFYDTITWPSCTITWHAQLIGSSTFMTLALFYIILFVSWFLKRCTIALFSLAVITSYIFEQSIIWPQFLHCSDITALNNTGQVGPLIWNEVVVTSRGEYCNSIQSFNLSI